MVKEKQVEHLPASSVKLTVTIGQEELRAQYNDLLARYAKDAQIKGFRRGHVPPDVLERKFGDSLRAETSQKVLEESLKQIFEEIDEKPLAYSAPRLEGEIDFDLSRDFTYSVKYDTYPQFEIASYKGVTIEVPKVAITEEDEKRELTALQEQNAIVVEKDGGAVASGDIVTVDYCELAEGDAEIEESRREDFVFTQGSGYNTYKIDDDVLGMKKGDMKIVEKEYPADAEEKELAGTKKRLKITMKGIKERKLPAVDDELAQDISDKYRNLGDLKADIRKRLEESMEGRLRELKVDALVAKVVEGSTIPVPESMVAAELESSWRSFVSQFRANEEQVLALLKSQERTRESLLEEWKPAAERRIRGQLVVQKMLELEKVETDDAEVDAELERQASRSNTPVAEAREYYERNGLLDYLRREIRERKLFDALLSESKIKEGKKISFLDLLGRNQ